MSMTGRYGSYSYFSRIPYSVVLSMNPVPDTTVASLLNVIKQTSTFYRPCKSINAADSFDGCYIGLDCDEVFPNIFIGDGATAKNKAYLKKIGITHVLNTAEGNGFSMVNTDRYFYHDTPFKYLGLPLLDLPTTRISLRFNETSDFIEDAIINRGKVYVHCFVGMSRSSTCVIAYLMIKRGLSAADAIRIIRQKREIHPNEGFLQQLADLDNSLRRERHLQ